MTQDKLRGNEYRSTTVCIDSYKSSVPVGRIYNPALSGGGDFYGTMQFILRMDALLDGMNFPQPFMETRSFNRREKRLPVFSTNAEIRHGSLATFIIRIFFRRNASWQGSVIWLESGREESFRSALELMVLADSALNEALESAQRVKKNTGKQNSSTAY